MSNVNDICNRTNRCTKNENGFIRILFFTRCGACFSISTFSINVKIQKKWISRWDKSKFFISINILWRDYSISFSGKNIINSAEKGFVRQKLRNLRSGKSKPKNVGTIRSDENDCRPLQLCYLQPSNTGQSWPGHRWNRRRQLSFYPQWRETSKSTSNYFSTFNILQLAFNVNIVFSFYYRNACTASGLVLTLDVA